MAGRGMRHLLLGDSGIDRAEEDGPAEAWLVETAGFAGWLRNDGASR